MIVPVILCGGSGKRLWPLSRTHYPKQFIDLVNETTLFQDTILRLPKNISKPLIICNENYRFLAAEQLREIDEETCGIILEPTSKNTAPAVALAALKLTKQSEDPLMLVLPADHIIENIKAFHHSIEIAKKHAKQAKLVAFGVIPTKPETGYGYIKATPANDKLSTINIECFIEKPNLNLAQKYLEENSKLKSQLLPSIWYWNSGMFMFKASVYLNELKKFEPKMLQACQKSYEIEHKDFDFVRLNNNEFYKCVEKSIDYAVMEHTKNAVVIPLDAKWSDVGSWSALWDVKTKDNSGNITTGDVILEKVKDTYIYSSDRLVSAINVSNLVIVDTNDALLVADKQYSQKITKIVNKLKKNNRSEINNHRKVYRPWGYFDAIDSGVGFQVKHIFVNSGAKLSLQKHKYRSEHWVVIKGVALVTCGDKIFELQENQSTYIPRGTIHRLENQKDMPLEIIEIQTGSYLGEDDIIRLEDDYQRN